MIHLKHRLPASLTLLLILGIFIASSMGAIAPQSTQAAGCTSPSIGFGRWRWCGYWYNKFQDSGESVRIGGIPGYVNTAGEFTGLLTSDMWSGDANHNTGARLVMLTMIGSGLPSPAQPVGSAKNVSGGQVNEFISRVNGYANLSENGTTSYGTSGRIEWSVWEHMPCGTVNTYWQPTYNDVAPYTESPSNSNCGNPAALDEYILFRNNDGSVAYRLRRLCMNPVGVMGALNTNNPDFNLTPSINTSVNGSAGKVAQVGDTVDFTYVVNNSGGTPSTPVGCNTYASTYTGYHPDGGGPPGGSPGGPNPGCPRSFGTGGTVVATENIGIATANQTICRTLSVDQATYGGGGRSTNEVCVIVANQPYVKVFGGDISAGNGLATAAAPSTCTSNPNAAVIAWNKRAASYSGAGAQYAVFALSTITDFSSAQNLSGGAAEPEGLSFANTSTNVASGDFGGSFGSAGCIPDYYSRMPATTLALPANVSSMVTGAYYSNVGTTLAGGNVNPGNKISVYINGDVFISSDITYPGTWSTNNMPLFELVVRGNIYVSSNVHRLDGVYIAQKNGAAGGTIYTCATSAAPLAITNGAFYNTCNSKLVINGAFVANSVELLRTAATLSQSSTGETSTNTGAGTNAAEVFNFNPTLWMVQPLDTSGTVDNYDAITSLPPVL